MANLKEFFKNIMNEVHCLEELTVECAEMGHFSTGINKLLKSKNEAYLKEKKAEENRVLIDLTRCEMLSYLRAT